VLVQPDGPAPLPGPALRPVARPGRPAGRGAGGVSLAQMAEPPPPESTATVMSRVRAARAVQADRFAGVSWSVNRDVPGAWLRGRWRLGNRVPHELDVALDRGRLSIRGYDRVLRVALVPERPGRARPPRPGRRRAGPAPAVPRDGGGGMTGTGLDGTGVPPWFEPDDERGARAAWSRLAEPGDEAAAFVVTELGACGCAAGALRATRAAAGPGGAHAGHRTAPRRCAARGRVAGAPVPGGSAP